MITATEAKAAAMMKQEELVPSVVSEFLKTVEEAITSSARYGGLSALIALKSPYFTCGEVAKGIVLQLLKEKGYQMEPDSSLPHYFNISWK